MSCNAAGITQDRELQLDALSHARKMMRLDELVALALARAGHRGEASGQLAGGAFAVGGDGSEATGTRSLAGGFPDEDVGRLRDRCLGVEIGTRPGACRRRSGRS